MASNFAIFVKNLLNYWILITFYIILAFPPKAINASRAELSDSGCVVMNHENIAYHIGLVLVFRVTWVFPDSKRKWTRISVLKKWKNKKLSGLGTSFLKLSGICICLIIWSHWFNIWSYRTTIILGSAIPLSIFLVWNGVILGTITNLGISPDQITDPLQQLQSSNGAVGVSSNSY